MGQIAKQVQEMSSKWYGHVVKIEEHYEGMRAIEMKVQGRHLRVERRA